MNERLSSRIGLLVLLVVATTVVGGLGMLIPEPEKPALGDAYQKETGAHLGIVLEIDPMHQFPDGTTREGWLLRDKFGTETWFPKDHLRKAELVLR